MMSASSQAAAAQAASLRALATSSTGKTREILLEAAMRLEAKATASTGLQSAAVPLTATAAEPPPEDAANDQEERIDTFSGYMPTSLPKCVLIALSGCAEESDSEAQAKQDVEIIEILDSNAGFQEAHVDGSSPVTNIKFSSLNFPSHISAACESALLASVTAPQTSDASAECLLELAKTKALSPLQLEGCCLAIDRHNRLLRDSSSGVTTRAGFFIGDAAGIGKGRQIAAILRDSLCRGRTRHLWVSVSRELALDAARDLRDCECHCPVHDGSDLLNQTSGGGKGLGVGGDLGKGVLFVTYSLLVSGQGKRMHEIVQWLSGTSGDGKEESNDPVAAEKRFDGLIVFDEAHKAKNLDANTQTSKLVIQLQEILPHARVLYCSATGVSDIKHMVYANRLGLWGAGSPLYPDFESFKETLSNRGVGSLELLALEMKQMGAFVARTLSWDGAEFNTMEIPLGEEERKMYDEATQWWFMVRAEIDYAVKVLGSTQKMVYRNYWSAHQRFFKEVGMCAKVRAVVHDAKKHLEQGCAIVIGLQSTGEASTQSALEELGQQILMDSGTPLPRSNGKTDYESIFLPHLVSTARSVMTSFVRNHFPVAPPQPDTPKIPTSPRNGFDDSNACLFHMHLEAQAERIKSLPAPEPIPELLIRRDAILEATKHLVLPPNPLDDLIDRLGGEERVAELTGRSGRVLRCSDKKRFHYVRRIQEVANHKSFGLSIPKSSEDTDKLNIVEKKKFVSGRKAVAIISDAASTGISLHAAIGSGAAHKRRVHYTIELPWAADKAIQQLGRSHRSGQLSAPLFKMVVTELGGERRFGAAVAKRMASLGALTKGDRRAATGSDLSEFDIDSIYGRRALSRLYQSLVHDDVTQLSAPSRHTNPILDDFIMQAVAEDQRLASKMTDEQTQRSYALFTANQALTDIGLASHDVTKNPLVKTFLNRLAGLPVLQQKLVFSLFMSALDDVIADAKATGEFEGSVTDVKASSIELAGAPEQLAVDKRSGALTMLNRLHLDRGVSLETIATQSLGDVMRQSSNEDSNAEVAETGFYVSKRAIMGRKLVLYAKRKVEPNDNGDYVFDPLGLTIITRPNTGKNPCPMPSRDLRARYHLVLSPVALNEGLQENEEKNKNSSEESDDPNPDAGPEAQLAADEMKISAIKVLRRISPQVARLWEGIYRDSDNFDRSDIAPRRAKLGLITGAVLHILPALEKAVMARSQAERASKVARVEISNSGERLVGIRFPLDDGVLKRLNEILQNDAPATAKGYSGAFRNEAFTPVNMKAISWATTERKTMRSFFAATASKKNGQCSGSKRKEPPPNEMKPSVVSAEKEQASSVMRMPSTKTEKKTPSIKLFFATKK